MAGQWTPIPIEGKLYLNSDEAVLTRAQAAIENGYINDAGGHTRFPGLKSFATLTDSGRTYLFGYGGDLVAATSQGHVFTIDKDAGVKDVTTVPVGGGGRVIFAPTTDSLLMAAGGQIVSYNGNETVLLSEDAPLSTHVGFIDSYVLAIERLSGRFQHSNAGAPSVWDALDTFAADGNPDDINALLVTPFREVLLSGQNSIEQFERLQSGSIPFFRRWSVGEGVLSPYLLSFADNAAFAINNLYEFVRLSGQTSEPIGDDISRLLETIDDWSDAWIGGYPDKPLHIDGQRFVMLQIPNATNDYDTKGYTFLYDLRKKQIYTLYGWDNDLGRPARWPGWSHYNCWGRTFVGGEGEILEFDLSNHNTNGDTQRWLLRTAHLGAGEAMIDSFRMHLKRGVGTLTTDPIIRVRCNRDNKGFGQWSSRNLGKDGERYMTLLWGGWGSAHHFQFEIEVTDDCELELTALEAQLRPIGH